MCCAILRNRRLVLSINRESARTDPYRRPTIDLFFLSSKVYTEQGKIPRPDALQATIIDRWTTRSRRDWTDIKKKRNEKKGIEDRYGYDEKDGHPRANRTTCAAGYVPWGPSTV